MDVTACGHIRTQMQLVMDGTANECYSTLCITTDERYRYRSFQRIDITANTLLLQNITVHGFPVNVTATKHYSLWISLRIDVTTTEHKSRWISLSMDFATAEHYSTWIIADGCDHYRTFQLIDTTVTWCYHYRLI